MKKEQNDNSKNVEKLLIGLLLTRGISATTIAKIIGVDKATISRLIPVSDIQADIKKYAQK